MNYDFAGWATRNNLRCSDGRTIMKDAFRGNDGAVVPLVWNHRHDEPADVLGHALLKNVSDGVRVYGTFNDTESGVVAKTLVQHGDITSLSIYANQLKQQGGNVLHGNIREVSLVHAGANPGAYIDSVIQHSIDGSEVEEAVIYAGYSLETDNFSDELEHADGEGEKIGDIFNTLSEKQKTAVYAIIAGLFNDADMQHSDGSEETDDDDYEYYEDEEFEGMTGEEIENAFESLDDSQREAVYAIIGEILEGSEEEEDMKHNVFEQDRSDGVYLSHADQVAIISNAKDRGTLKGAIADYYGEDVLEHGFKEIEQLFPEYKELNPGAPEMITRDNNWVGRVMSAVHKSPFSRVKTRQIDVRDVTLRAKGYKKGEKKKAMEEVTLVKRTTDPQTIYIKDSLDRDDIVDITDFEVVDYEYKIMRLLLQEELALAILIGDGREADDPDKIKPTHIRPIWGDAPLYTIHGDVDFTAAAAELQGTETGAHFGENYIYAEAIITKALYLRERYKGTGNPDFYCTPHLLNIMLLARDLNGRRIYESKSDLAKALNVDSIYTVEQFEDKTREVADGSTLLTKKLLGIFVNLTDYQVGATKGGEITSFNQFDIDFNKEKYLIETRTSGALRRVYSAVVLEEDVTSTPSGEISG